MNIKGNNNNMMNKTQCFRSDTKDLEQVRLFIRSIGKTCDISHCVIHDVVLAVNEACCNIIKHSYCSDTNGTISITSVCDKHMWKIRISDSGKPLVKEKIKHRDLDDVRPGGLGVFFMKKLMDSVEYIRDDEHSENSVVMTKKIKG